MPRYGSVALLALVALGRAAAAQPSCLGDCNRDGEVTVDEIVVAVQIALAAVPVEVCVAIDRDGDGDATIDEILAAVQHAASGCPEPGQWRFTDATVGAGLAFAHTFSGSSSASENVGGVAVADYDGDGYVDVYAVAGNTASDRLFRNQGDGTFAEVGAAAGIATAAARSSGPAFADVDGDGDLDLFVGGIDGTAPRLLRNEGDGTFADITTNAGLDLAVNVIGAAFGDCDNDGDLDLALAHWGSFLDGRPPLDHLWINDGNGGFTPAPESAGVRDLGGPHPEVPQARFDWTFTPNFTDIDGDGWADLLYASDYGTSRVLRNRGDCSFLDATTPVISDENGMGAALGDFDNDGELDWFVTSIFDPDGSAQGQWGVTGNRLYRNDGSSGFTDATAAAGVADGNWGWAACAADFDNDGNLDIFHVNGFGSPADPFFAEFNGQPARLFLGRGDGSFVAAAAERGIADTGSGRGVSCADYDRDGDIDVFLSNQHGSFRLYRNDGGNRASWLTVRFRLSGANSQGIGARVHVTAAGRTQLREIRAGSNYVSQDPPEAHFGLGDAMEIDELRVEFRGRVAVLANFATNRIIDIDDTDLPPRP
mgnify:CR=1 FL=1